MLVCIPVSAQLSEVLLTLWFFECMYMYVYVPELVVARSCYSTLRFFECIIIYMYMYVCA